MAVIVAETRTRVLGGLLAAGMLVICGGPLAAQTIRGTVIDQTARIPVFTGSVILIDAGGRLVDGTAIGENGEFSLFPQRGGTYRLRADAAGYATFETPIQLGAAEVLHVELRLNPVTMLDTLTVTGARMSIFSVPPRLRGFYERRRRGLGLYYSAEDIEQRNASNITDLLRMAPGVRVVPTSEAGSGTHYTVRMLGRGFKLGEITSLGRSTGSSGRLDQVEEEGSEPLAVATEACVPMVYLDNVRLGPVDEASGVGLDGLVSAQELAGIEIYRNVAETPAEFVTSEARCGVIVLWTKRG